MHHIKNTKIYFLDRNTSFYSFQVNEINIRTNFVSFVTIFSAQRGLAGQKFKHAFVYLPQLPGAER